MSRFKSLKANPRRSLAALATVLVAVGITGASGASFTAQTANPSNTFAAGTLSMSNDKDGVAILSASNMRPGDPATKGEVVIKNNGTWPASSRSPAGPSSLRHRQPDLPQAERRRDRLRPRQGLQHRRRHVNKYTGPLATMTAPSALQLGRQ